MSGVYSKALYFPFIKTPSDDWFGRVLLFWDAVGTIVPGGLESDPRFMTPRMIELEDVGLLEVVRPVLDFRKLPKFAAEFLRCLDGDQEVQLRSARRLSDNALVMVHLWKLGGLVDDLAERNLARPARGGGWELWAEIEERTADIFMAYLAVTLAAVQPVRMDPVTNRKRALDALSGADGRSYPGAGEDDRLRTRFLAELLPGSSTVSGREIADFKSAHNEQLAAFRDAVNAALLQALSLPDGEARVEQEEIAMRALIRERDAIVDLMQRRRWPGITFGSIGGLLAAAAAAAEPFATGGDPKAAAFAAPGLISAIYAACRDLRSRPEFATAPLAYAALAQRQLSA